ncbi:DB module [Ancylostoma duodenale]|uniref:DB module n=1 Tax=Ancylostoma duodenale TaxID=51022 RepID=A0A0C2F7P8_9BILA|nr:DB module [Ancylostoma duodenale]
MTSACPLTALPHVHFCAARGVDHTQCCRAAGVQQQCLMFCDQICFKIRHMNPGKIPSTHKRPKLQSPDTTNQLTLQHLGCLDGFEGMKDCFVEHALTEYYRTKQTALEHYQRIQIN